MVRLAGRQGFQFRAYHFDHLAEIAAAGAARAMLPMLVGEDDDRLKAVSDIVLQQPLWMLFHKQDRDVPHLKGIRSWVSAMMEQQLM